MVKGKLSKKYYKKLLTSVLFFILINIFYLVVVVKFEVNFVNLVFLAIVDIMIFMTLVADYVF